MKKLLLSLLVPCGLFAQATAISVQTTSMQAVLSYTSPDSNACTVHVFNDGGLRFRPSADATTEVADTDTTIFSGAAADLTRTQGGRVLTVVNGLQRQVTLGFRGADTANGSDSSKTGQVWARVLQNGTLHHATITCTGGAVTKYFVTRVTPFGKSNPEYPSFNSSYWRNYNWGSMAWTDKTRWYLDPMTGIPFKPVMYPGDIANTNTGFLFSAVLDPASAWITPANITSGNTGTTASTATNGAKIIVGVDGDTTYPQGQNLFGLDDGIHQQYPSVDDIGVHVFAGASGSTVGASFCWTQDWATCLTGSVTKSIPVAAVADLGYANTSFPSAVFGSWGGPPIPRDRFSRHGYVNIAGASGSTLTLASSNSGPICGGGFVCGQNSFDSWMAGKKVLVPGSSPTCLASMCDVASVQSSTQLTLVQTLTPDSTGTAAYHYELGLLITKVSGGTLNISVKHDVAFSQLGQNAAGQVYEECNPNAVTVQWDSTGTAYASSAQWFQAHVCQTIAFDSVTYPYALYLVGDNGDTRYLSSLVPPSGGTDAAGGNFTHGLGWHTTLGTRAYAGRIAANSGYFSLYQLDYDAATCKWKELTPTGGKWPGSSQAQQPYTNDCITWTNLTPSSTNLSVDQQIIANDTSYNATYMGIGDSSTTMVVVGPYLVVERNPSGQNGPDQWYEVFDLNGTWLKAYNAFDGGTGGGIPALRWTASHSGQAAGAGPSQVRFVAYAEDIGIPQYGRQSQMSTAAVSQVKKTPGYTIVSQASGIARSTYASPYSGTATTQAFTFTYTEPTGASTILIADAGFGSSYANSCVVRWNTGAGDLYMFNDDGSLNTTTYIRPGGSLSFGGSPVESNSQCSITGTTLSVSQTGTNLALTFTVVFNGGWTPGNVRMFQWFQYNGGFSTYGIQPTGQYTLGSVTTGTTQTAIVTLDGVQSALVSTALPEPLLAVVADAMGRPVPGVAVTFTAPSSGPSGTFTGGSNVAIVTSDSHGLLVSPVFTTNSTAGTFQVALAMSGLTPFSNDTSLPATDDGSYDSKCNGLGSLADGQCAHLRMGAQPCRAPAGGLWGGTSDNNWHPCPLDSTRTGQAVFQVGDLIADTALPGTSNERMRILAITVNTSTDIVLDVQRWALPICQDSNLHANGWTGYMTISGGTECNVSALYIDPSNNSFGDGLSLAHSDVGVSPNNLLRLQTGGAGYTNGGSGPLTGQPFTALVNYDFGFAGAANSGVLLEDYPWLRHWTASDTDKNWSMTHRHIESNGNGSVTQKSGNVYKVNLNGAVADFKRMGYFATVGGYNLLDISGPSSLLLSTDTDKRCYTYKAGECFAGSAAGDVYVASAFMDTSHWCLEGFIGAGAPCAFGGHSVAAWGLQMFSTTPNDPQGLGVRRISMIPGPSRQWVYAQMRSHGTGKTVMGRCEWIDGNYSSTCMWLLPPASQRDDLNRTQYIPIPVNTGGSPAYSEATFGYGEFGTPAQGYCTTYQSTCNTSGTPFSYAADTRTLVTGGKINVPALSDHILYLTPRTSPDGTTWTAGATTVIAVP